MTNKSSSGDKLVASIRKTKAGLSTSESQLAKKSTSAPQKPVRATKKKVVAKKAAPKKKSVSKPAVKKEPSDTKQTQINQFHSGRRVWPD